MVWLLCYNLLISFEAGFVKRKKTMINLYHNNNHHHHHHHVHEGLGMFPVP
jgi:hypothetical protein